MPTAADTDVMAAAEAANFSAAAGIDVARLDQYFGPWAILDDRLRAAVARLKSIDLRLHVEGKAEGRRQKAEAGNAQSDVGLAGSKKPYPMAAGGIAVIDLSGALMKQESSLSDSTSTVFARRQVRMAAADDECRGILLRIDSPGGTTSGTADLAADVARAATRKPVYAYIEDLGASAAYWVASQCTKVFANATALVGSIGTYAVLEDSSGAAAQDGIKVHVLKTGTYKGGGVEGTAITQEFLDYWQQTVDALNEHFVRGVAAGRGLSLTKTRELADGRVWIATEAQQNGLIDGVKSLDEVLAAFPKKSKPATESTEGTELKNSATSASSVAQNPGVSMADDNKTPQPATFAELKAGCTGADATFLCSQLEASATLAQAQTAWMAEQNKRLADAEARAKKPGVAALKQGASDDSTVDGDPVDRWNELVDAQIEVERKKPGSKKKNETQIRQAAVFAIHEREPELHAAMLNAFPRVYGQNMRAKQARDARRAMEKYGGSLVG